MLGVVQERHLQHDALVWREEVIHDLRGVAVHVHEQARHIVQGYFVLDGLHDPLALHSVRQETPLVDVNPEVLDLDDAVLLRKVHLRLEVHVLGLVEVQDVDLRKPFTLPDEL